MPAIANITVKKSDNTTDIVFDALTGSGGDGQFAVWRQDTGAPAGLPVGMRAEYRLLSKWNGNRTARRLEGVVRYPYAVQDSTTTLYSISDTVIIAVQAIVPQAIPAAQITEAVYQSCNLFAAGLSKQSIAAGFAPV